MTSGKPAGRAASTWGRFRASFRVGMITETRGCRTPARTAPARRADSETAAEGAVTARVSVIVTTTVCPPPVAAPGTNPVQDGGSRGSQETSGGALGGLLGRGDAG